MPLIRSNDPIPPSPSVLSLRRKCLVEAIGTFWLVFAGCGSAVISGNYPQTGIGFLGVALAFGLSVTTFTYAFGHISGAHLNPAVTLGLTAARKFPQKDVAPYVASQLLGATGASSFLYLIAIGSPVFSIGDGFAANGYGEHSPGHYGILSAFLAEMTLTFFFLLVILRSTSKRAPKGFAPLAIGLTYTLAHLVSIPITNTSLNPARSTGPALFAGNWALAQLWLFWAAPLLGAYLAGKSFYAIDEKELASVDSIEFRSKHA